MDHGFDRKFAKLVVELDHCSPQEIQVILRELQQLRAQGQNIHLGQLLVRKHILNANQYAQIAAAAKMASSDLDATDPATGTIVEPAASTRPEVPPLPAPSPPPAPSAGEGEHPEDDRGGALRTKGIYDILEVIGEGAMGTVMRARHQVLGREVALKFLKGTWEDDSPHVKRFMREGQIVSKLHHENIVQIYDWNRYEGDYYFAMEFVEGRTLEDMIYKEQTPLKVLLRLLVDVARGMDYAHGCGVIHRDLKPGNILVRTDGVAKITDFGLARPMDDNQPGISSTGQHLGTPFYMSPEQCRGHRNQVDHRADIWALGVILYEVLTKKRPFTALSIFELFPLILTAVPRPPRELNPAVPPGAENVCMKAIEKDPARRYQSAGELADDLQRVLEGDAPAVRAPTGGWRLRRALATPKLVPASIASVAIVGLVAAVVAFTARPAPSRQPWEASKAAFDAALVERDFQRAASELQAMREANATSKAIAQSESQAGDALRSWIDESLKENRFEDAVGAISLGGRFGLDLDEDVGRKGALRAKELMQGNRATALALCNLLRDLRYQDPWILKQLSSTGTLVVDLGVPVKVSLERLDEPGELTFQDDKKVEAPVAFGVYELRIETLDGKGTLGPFGLLLSSEPAGRQVVIRFDPDVVRNAPEAVIVPGGPFRMPTDGDPHYLFDVSDSLLVDRTEVRRGDYARFVQSLPSESLRRSFLPVVDLADDRSVEAWSVDWDDPAPEATWAKLPVSNVTWVQAMGYAVRQGMRLPSIEEWQKAARGVLGWEYPWGPAHESGKAQELRDGPAPVDAFDGSGEGLSGASPYGILNLGGNVAEWAFDTEGRRVLAKGGGFRRRVPQASEYEAFEVPDDLVARYDIGFRCVRGLGESNSQSGLLTWKLDRFREALETSAGGDAEQHLKLLQAHLLEKAVRPKWYVETAFEVLASRPSGASAAFDTLVRSKSLLALRAAAIVAPVASLPALLDRLADHVPLEVELALLRRNPADFAGVAATLRATIADPTASRSSRCLAAALLANGGDPAGVEALLDGIDPEDVAAHEQAILDLSWLGEPRVVPFLFDLQEAQGRPIGLERQISPFLVLETALPDGVLTRLRDVAVDPERRSDCRLVAAKVLIRVGDAGVGPILDRMEADFRDGEIAALRKLLPE